MSSALIDTWAAVAAAIAGSAIAIRAHMLRPHQEAWTHAPAIVWTALSALGLGQLMAAVSLFFGAHASAREAMVYSLAAIAACVMLWNLNRNGRQALVERERIAEQVRTAMDVSGPPAHYPHERAG